MSGFLRSTINAVSNSSANLDSAKINTNTRCFTSLAHCARRNQRSNKTDTHTHTHASTDPLAYEPTAAQLRREQRAHGDCARDASRSATRASHRPTWRQQHGADAAEHAQQSATWSDRVNAVVDDDDDNDDVAAHGRTIERNAKRTRSTR